MDDVINDLYKAYASRDAVKAASLYSPEGEHTEAASERTRTGRGDVEHGLTKFFAMMENILFEKSFSVISGKKIVVVYVMTATVSMSFTVIAARGAPVKIKGAHVFEFEGGLIRRSTDYWNEDDFKRQIGVM